MQRQPIPPFTAETARQKVQAAEDAWNSRDPDRVAARLLGRFASGGTAMSFSPAATPSACFLASTSGTGNCTTA